MSDVVAPTTFLKFTSLPTEIRFTIWELTLEPRDINLEVDVEIAKIPSFDQQDFSDSNFAFSTGKNTDHLPAAVQVCKESRELLSPRYPWILQDEIRGQLKFKRHILEFLLRGDGLYFRDSVEYRRGAQVNVDLDTIVLRLEGRNFETHKFISPLTLLGKVGTQNGIGKIKCIKFSSELWSWAEDDALFKDALGAFKGLEEICVVVGENCSVCEEGHYGSKEEIKKRIVKVLSEVKQEAEGWTMPEIKTMASWERELG